MTRATCFAEETVLLSSADISAESSVEFSFKATRAIQA